MGGASGHDHRVRGELEAALAATDDDALAAALLVSRDEPERFALLYDGCVPAVTGFFYRRTACPHTAADLTAETFAEAFRVRHRYRPERGTPKAWLFGIARNQLGHYLRRQRVDDRARRKLGMAPVALDDASLEAIEARADGRELLDALREALATLSPGVADAVRLRVGLDLGYAEVARRLGCSEGAARVRVARGLARLHDLVGIAR